MKKLLTLLAAIVLMSCSNDNNGGGTKPYLESALVIYANGNDNLNLNFVYNSQKQLVSINSNIDYLQWAITYDANKVKSVSRTDFDATFGYSGDILSSATINGVSSDIQYNSADNKYVFDGLELTLNAHEDVIYNKILTGNTVTNDFIAYDDTKKGALFNLGTHNNFLSFLYFNANVLFASRPALATSIYQITNTYNAAGYLTKAVYTQQNGQPYLTISYTYTNL